MPGYIRFEESRPSQVREILSEAPIAYVPFGSLEWHGEHNPLGLDGVKVEELLRRTAAVTGGVLFPTVFWGAFNTMPFPFTFHFPPAVMRRVVWKMLRQMRRDGFRVIVMLTGHYPPSYVVHLHIQALLFNRKRRGVALAFPEMAFAYEVGYFGDHAAHWETSIMMALRPELVDTSLVPPHAGPLTRARKWGVMGLDPGLHADRSLGEEVVRRVVEGLSDLVKDTLESGSDAPYRALWRAYSRQQLFCLESWKAQFGFGGKPARDND